MNKQEFKEARRAQSVAYQSSKGLLLMEIRKASAVQVKRITALHHRQRVRFIAEKEVVADRLNERKLWAFIREFKQVRTRREKAEKQRQVEIIRRRREYWKQHRRARRIELARRRLEAMNLRSVEARQRKAVATGKLLAYAPDYAFDMIGQRVRFRLKNSRNTGVLTGKVENLRQHHGVVMFSVRVRHSGRKRDLFLVSINNVIL